MVKNKMMALVKKEAKEGIWLEEVPIPEVKVNDVLIKIHRTAICGTDIHIYNWDDWARKTIKTPMVIGHEFCGVIEKVGLNVKGLKVGMRVSGEGHIVCQSCRNCLAGNGHLCARTIGVGVNRDGAFAQYLCIPDTNVRSIEDKNISSDIIACFDPFGNAVHTALSYDLVGEDVLITGAGPIGIMAALVASYAGARNVVITNRSQWRLNLAKKFPQITAVNVKEESLKNIMQKLNIREGFDVGLEMSGNVTAFNQMIDHMSYGGNIALLGILNSNSKIDWNKVVFHGLNIRGIYGRKMFETWYKMKAMIQGGLDISKIITHKFHYTNFQEAFEIMKSGKSGKIVLDWTN